MKKVFLFALIANLLYSCSGEDFSDSRGYEDQNTSNNQIAFVTANAKTTRSGDVTSLDGFTATAVTNDGKTYFENMSFNLNGDLFKSISPYFWPENSTLDFFAVNAGDIEANEGIVSLVITNNDGTNDLVAATYKKALKMTSVPLNFRHILSRLSVKVKAYDSTDGYDYEILGVKAYVKGSGVYKFDAATGGFGTWENKKNYVTYSWTSGFPSYIGKSYSERVLCPNQVFYVLPATSSSDMITFDMDYKVYKNGVLIADCTGDNCGTIDISEPDLAMGKSVCYVLEPSYYEDGTDEIKFTSTVNSWGKTQEIDSDYAM